MRVRIDCAAGVGAKEQRVTVTRDSNAPRVTVTRRALLSRATRDVVVRGRGGGARSGGQTRKRVCRLNAGDGNDA